jgi:hypothetical protein
MPLVPTDGLKNTDGQATVTGSGLNPDIQTPSCLRLFLPAFFLNCLTPKMGPVGFAETSVTKNQQTPRASHYYTTVIAGIVAVLCVRRCGVRV